MNLHSIRKSLFWVTLVIVIPLRINAQEISMEETLGYINGKLGTAGTIDVIKGVIVVQFNEGGELYREDRVLYKSLDLKSINYDAKNQLFIVNCKNSQKCVDRQVFIRKTQRPYARLSFPVTLSPKSAEGMKKAFTHMIRLIEDVKYKSSEPFE